MLFSGSILDLSPPHCPLLTVPADLEVRLLPQIHHPKVNYSEGIFNPNSRCLKMFPHPLFQNSLSLFFFLTSIKSGTQTRIWSTWWYDKLASSLLLGKTEGTTSVLEFSLGLTEAFIYLDCIIAQLLPLPNPVSFCSQECSLINV